MAIMVAVEGFTRSGMRDCCDGDVDDGGTELLLLEGEVAVACTRRASDEAPDVDTARWRRQ